jgi:succinoglycan biosynthesis transport protein ExoP
MDTFDSYRPTVPARLPAPRPGALVPRSTSGLPEAASTSPLSIRVALRGARRYWWLVLLLWVVGSAGIGAAVYAKVRPAYKAFGILRVFPAATDIYGVRTTGETFDPFLQTLVSLITSPSVLTAAASTPEAAALDRVRMAGDDVAQELRRSINVGVVPGTYLIEVSMTSQDSHEAAILVNAVVKAFLASNSEWSEGMTSNQIEKLKTYLGELEGETKALERRWKDIVAKGDIDTQIANQKKEKAARAEESGTDRSSITIDQYKRVTQQLFEVKIELVEAEALLESAAAAARAGTSKDSTPEEDRARIEQQVLRQFKLDPDVVQLETQIMTATEKRNKVRKIAVQSGDPAERDAQQALDRLMARYKKLWESKSQAFREDIERGGPKGQGPDAALAEASARVKTLQAKQAALKQTAANLDIDNKRQATDSVDIALLLEERSTLKGMQDSVIRRLEQLKFEARGETRVVSVNPATPSSKPISDKRTTYLAMTPVGVLGTVLGLIVLLEIRAGRVADPDVLSSRIKHEVFSIAPLPDIRPGDDPNDGKAEQRLARFVQSLDHLRVALCDGGAVGEGRCVMITSATGGEGKTTLAAHLAARCANAGTSTLLVDADMRRASLGRLLDVPAGAGLGDVLGGDADLDDALITVQAGGFHFLSAGTPGRDPSRVLKSTRLAELIGRLRRTYDLVIIDTPPVLPVADALIVGRWVDGAVMAARFDASRLPLVERANRQLALGGVPVLGVVVNGVRGQDTTYGNYAYSYNHPGRTDPSDGSPTA